MKKPRMIKAQREADNERWRIACETLDNMRRISVDAVTHARFAMACQDRVGYRGPDDGGEPTARMRDYQMRVVANLNWQDAQRRGLVLG